MKINYLLLVSISLCLIGCTTAKNELNQFYIPLFPEFKQKRISPESVRLLEIPPAPNAKVISPFLDKGYILLGAAKFSGPEATPEELRAV